MRRYSVIALTILTDAELAEEASRGTIVAVEPVKYHVITDYTSYVKAH